VEQRLDTVTATRAARIFVSALIVVAASFATRTIVVRSYSWIASHAQCRFDGVQGIVELVDAAVGVYSDATLR
jgi:hypothetical protein